MMSPFIEKNKKPLVIVGVLFSVLGISWGTFLRSDFESLGRMKKDIVVEKQKKESADRIYFAEHKLKSYKSLFLKPAEISWLIEELGKVQKETGVSINQMAPAQNENMEDYKKSALRVEVNGDYHQVGKFIAKIESLPRFLKVRELDLTMDLDIELKSSLRATMILIGIAPRGEIESVFSS